MKKMFLFFVLMFCGVLFAQEVAMETVSVYDQILNWFSGAWAWAPKVLVWLGGIVVAGTIIDKIIPDTYDKGFMTKVYNAPVIGLLLKSLVRFSPFSADVEQTKK